MKNNLLRMTIGVALAAAAASAQSSIPLKADVPFDFVIANQTLPAGHYTVAEGPASGTVMIRSTEGSGSVFAMSNRIYVSSGRRECRLVFHRYGNNYFLSEVWGADNDGHQLPPSSEERKLAAGITPSTNTILASLR